MNTLSNFFPNMMGDMSAINVLFLLLAAAATFTFAIGLFLVVSGMNRPVRRRIAAVSGQPLYTPFSFDNLSRLMRFLSVFLMPKRTASKDRVRNQLIYAGYDSLMMMRIYFGAKLFLILLFFFTSAILLPIFYSFTEMQVLGLSCVAAYFGSLLLSLALDARVRARQKKLRFGLPDALDLLVVCVESGLGIAPAIQRVAEEIDISHPELAAELAIVNAEMRAGIDRGVALTSLGTRTGLSEIRGLTGLLSQTMQFGGSIGATLRVYSADFRDRRLQAAEEQAAKVSTKMIFPLVLCIFPSFFLVAIGPAVIALMGAFSK